MISVNADAILGSSCTCCFAIKQIRVGQEYFESTQLQVQVLSTTKVRVQVHSIYRWKMLSTFQVLPKCT